MRSSRRLEASLTKGTKVSYHSDYDDRNGVDDNNDESYDDDSDVDNDAGNYLYNEFYTIMH